MQTYLTPSPYPQWSDSCPKRFTHQAAFVVGSGSTGTAPAEKCT